MIIFGVVNLVGVVVMRRGDWYVLSIILVLVWRVFFWKSFGWIFFGISSELGYKLLFILLEKNLDVWKRRNNKGRRIVIFRFENDKIFSWVWVFGVGVVIL